MTESEVSTSDLELLDDPYMHATCYTIHPWGSLSKGTKFNTLCGKESLVLVTQDKCPECAELFGKSPCPLCHKDLKDH